MKFFSRRVAKSGANGLYVYRPVLNAQEWIDWAAAAGVPNLVAAADLHVTVVSSSTDAKVPLACDPLVIRTDADYWGAGRFGFLGKDNQAFCFIFSSWELQDRFYTYSSNGTTSDFPGYVPHLTFSMDAAAFDLPDTALANVPCYIVLGAEIRADRKLPDPSDQMIDDDAGAEDDAETIVVVLASVKQAAETVLAEKTADVDPRQMAALLAIAHDKPLTKAAAKALAKATWAPELLQNIMGKTEARGLKPPSDMKSKEAKITIAQVSGEVAKAFGASGKGYDEERRWVYGVASVSTIAGALVEDLDGDFVTTKCLEDYCAALITSGAGGDFEHETDAVNTIVGALTFSTDLQKSLGIDLGMEFLLTVTHVPDDADWEKVKKGEWMQSIAGVFYYED